MAGLCKYGHIMIIHKLYPFSVSILILSSMIITCSFSEIEDYPFLVNNFNVNGYVSSVLYFIC